MFVADESGNLNQQQEKINLNITMSTLQFLIFVIVVEHVLLILKTFIEQTIDDTPDFVVIGERERNSIVEIQTDILKFDRKQKDSIKDKKMDITEALYNLGSRGLLKVDAKNTFVGAAKRIQYGLRLSSKATFELG